MTTKEKILLLTLAIINFTHIVDFMVLMPLGPQLMRAFNIGTQQFSVLVSSYILSSAFSSIAMIFIADRLPRKLLVLVAYAGFVVATLACAFAPNFSLMLLARIVTGLFGGVLSAQVFAIVGDVFPYQRRAQAVSIVATSFSMASVAGVPTGLYLASHYGWQMCFTALAVLGVGVIALIVRFLPRMDGHLHNIDGTARLVTPPLQNIINIARNPNQLWALGLSVLGFSSVIMVVPFLATYLVTNTALAEDHLFLVYLLGGAATLFTGPLIGLLADRFGKHRMFWILTLMSLLPVYLVTTLTPQSLVIVLVITTAHFILVNGRFVPLQALISGVVAPQQRGSFMALNSAVQQLTNAATVYLAGLIITQSSNGQMMHFDRVGMIGIVGGLLAIAVSRRVTHIAAG